MTNAPSARLPPTKRGTQRGKVVGWSAKSRMRLRRYLLMHEPAQDSIEGNLTLTIPGDPVTVEQMRSLWKLFCREVQRRGWSMVWRMEVQKRGQPHWHCVLTLPDAHTVQHDPTARLLAWDQCRRLWLRCLDSLGPVTWTGYLPEARTSGTFDLQSRSDIPQADVRGFNLQIEDSESENRWAWRRYLQDHASKAKQEQIAEGFGRHWGVVGRGRYRLVTPQEVVRLNDAEYFRVVRWLQRMVSGMTKCSKAPFGSKRGYRQRRGTHGKSVWFSNPETVSRLIRLALQTAPANG